MSETNKEQKTFGYNCVVVVLAIIILSYFMVGFNKRNHYTVVTHINGKMVVHKKTGFYIKWLGKSEGYVAKGTIVMK